eukprot:g36040.t1
MSRFHYVAQRVVDVAAQTGQYVWKHPFPMSTTFRKCFLVNFSMQPQALARVLPVGLTPDLYQDKAFLSVVIADLEAMRPSFIPRAFGSSFTQVVHRAIVRAPNGERGVYFVRSDANDILMSAAGNVFSNFHFNLATAMWMGKEQHLPPSGPGSLSEELGMADSPIPSPATGWLPEPNAQTSKWNRAKENDRKAGQVHFMLEPWMWNREPAAIHASFDMSTASLQMPSSSLFAGQSVREAQKYFVELYVAFASWPEWDHWSAVRIDRTRWNLVAVEHMGQPIYQFMQGSSKFAPGACQLDSVFYVHDLDYHWKVIEKHPFALPASHPVCQLPGPLENSAASVAARTWPHLQAPSDHLVSGATTVFYDGSCPLCNAEIAYYMRLAGPVSSAARSQLRFFDLSAHDHTGPLQSAFGISMEQAMASMFVVDDHGHLHTGAYAFAALWRALPAGPWTWLSRAVTVTPGLLPLAQIVYSVWANNRGKFTWLSGKKTNQTAKAVGIGASCRRPNSS